MRRIAALFNKMSTTTQAPSDPPSSCPLLALFSLLISHLQTHSPHNTCNDRIRLLALCDFINSFNAVVNLTLHAGVREHGTNEGGVLGGLGGGADGAEFFDLLHEEVYISRVREGKGVCVRDFIFLVARSEGGVYENLVQRASIGRNSIPNLLTFLRSTLQRRSSQAWP